MSLFPDAIDAFDQTLKLRANDAAALYGLGRAKMSVSKFDEAQQAFERYVQVRPADASGHYALGFSLQALQRASDARAEYEKSMALQPLQTESYFQLGLMELEAGDPDQAAKQFGHVLDRAPQHAGALTGMGRVRFQEKHYADGSSNIRKGNRIESRTSRGSLLSRFSGLAPWPEGRLRERAPDRQPHRTSRSGEASDRAEDHRSRPGASG